MSDSVSTRPECLGCLEMPVRSLDVPAVSDLDDLVKLVRVHVDSVDCRGHPCGLLDFLDDAGQHCCGFAFRGVSFFE